MASESTLPISPETESRQPVDLLKAYKLRVQHGLSYGQIAQAIGQPRSSVHRALTDLCTILDDPDRLQHYHDARGSLLSAVEERLIGSLVDEEALSKSSLNNRAYAFTQIFNARRLEQGQSTTNLSIFGQIIQRAEAQLGSPLTSTVASTPASAPQEGQIAPKRKKIK